MSKQVWRGVILSKKVAINGIRNQTQMEKEQVKRKEHD
jgi:hypothetical protein